MDWLHFHTETEVTTMAYKKGHRQKPAYTFWLNIYETSTFFDDILDDIET